MFLMLIKMFLTISSVEWIFSGMTHYEYIKQCTNYLAVGARWCGQPLTCNYPKKTTQQTFLMIPNMEKIIDIKFDRLNINPPANQILCNILKPYLMSLSERSTTLGMRGIGFQSSNVIGLTLSSGIIYYYYMHCLIIVFEQWETYYKLCWFCLLISKNIQRRQSLETHTNIGMNGKLSSKGVGEGMLWELIIMIANESEYQCEWLGGHDISMSFLHHLWQHIALILLPPSALAQLLHPTLSPFASWSPPTLVLPGSHSPCLQLTRGEGENLQLIWLHSRM